MFDLVAAYCSREVKAQILTIRPTEGEGLQASEEVAANEGPSSAIEKQVCSLDVMLVILGLKDLQCDSLLMQRFQELCRIKYLLPHAILRIDMNARTHQHERLPSHLARIVSVGGRPCRGGRRLL